MLDLTLVLSTAVEVDAVCRSNHWRYCIIGGIAVQRWGSTRYTRDVDLTLLTGYGNEEAFINDFLASFPPREPGAAKFALQSRVLLAKSNSNIPVDVALGALPFEEATIRRATPWRIDAERSIITCSANDLVVHKVFAGRGQDWVDVESVLIRQFPRLNFPQIRNDLVPLLELKEDTESLPRFESLLKTIRQRLAN